jgi:two-component system sensor histidine kinase/response regulator
MNIHHTNIISILSSLKKDLNDPKVLVACEMVMHELGHLLEQLRRYEILAEATDSGFWEIDLLYKRAWRNRKWLDMLGYTEMDTSSTIDLWLDYIHPNDKLLISEEVEKFKLGEIQRIEIEYRLRCANGNYIWVLDKGEVIRSDQKGKPIILSGIQTNISKFKENEEAINRLLEVMEFAPDFISYTDKRGKITYANKALIEFLGFNPVLESKSAIRIHTPA